MANAALISKGSLIDLYGQPTGVTANPPVGECRLLYDSTANKFHVIDSNGNDIIVAAVGDLALPSADIFVGNGSGVAAAVAVSGDLTLINTGAFTVAKIQGTSISGVTGTGNAVLSASPSLTGALAITSSGSGANAQLTITNSATGGAEWFITSTDNGNGIGGGFLCISNGSSTTTAAFRIDPSKNCYFQAAAILEGATSGATTVQANATASGTLTLPAATDTLIGKATTDVLTNKTFDTAGTGNVFKINGTQVSAVTGTGNNVLATGPTLTGPVSLSEANASSDILFIGASGTRTTSPVLHVQTNDSTATQTVMFIEDQTNFAFSGDFLQIQAHNGSDSSILIHLLNSGTGDYLDCDSAFKIAKSGKLSAYGGVVTAGQGTAPIQHIETATSQAANFNSGSAKTLVTPTVSGSVYRIVASEFPVVAATGGTLPSLTIGYTDRAGIARTFAMWTTTSTSANSTFVQNSVLIETNGSTAITATSAGYAAGSGTALSYDLMIAVEQMI